MAARRIALALLLLAGTGCEQSRTAVRVQVEPREVDVVPFGTVQFTAVVEGSYGTGVTWEVRTNGDDVGTIDPDTGLYTAPGRIPRENEVVIQATSRTDPEVRDRSRITIVSAPISPARGPTIGGTRVTVTGQDFDTAPPAVFFGALAGLDPVVDSSVRLRVTVPPSATGIAPVDVRLVTADRTLLYPRAFHYAATDLVFGGARFLDACEGTASRGIALDLEGDGDEDIALLCAGDAGELIALFRNDGAGRLAIAATIPTLDALVQPVRSFAAGDLDGDGADDLLVADQAAAQSFLNDGTGSAFTAVAPLFTFPANDQNNVDQVLLAKIDGDAFADVVLAGDDLTGGMTPSRVGFVRVGIGNGTGGFATTPRAITLENPEKRFVSLSTADMQADGDVDLLLFWDGDSTTDGGVVPFLNVGGVFADAAAGTNNGVGVRVQAGAAGDVGSDGTVDVFLESNGTVFRMESAGGGGFGPEVLVAGALAPATFLQLQDLDADGEPDLVSWGTNRADEGFGIPFLSVSWGPLDGTIVADQFDLSTRRVEDLFGALIGSAGTLELVVLGDGVERVAAAADRDLAGQRRALADRVRSVERRGGATPRLLAALDVGGVGSVATLGGDLAVVDTATLPGSAGATLRTKFANVDAVTGIEVLAMDGVSSGVWVLYGSGGGTLGAVVVVPFPGPVVDAITADVGGDGIADLLAVGDGDAWVAMGTGTGFGPAQSIAEAAFSGARFMDATDFDEDGLPEMLIATGGTAGQLSIHEADGGVFAPAVRLDIGSSPVDVLVADVNLDYIPDLVVQSVVPQVPELSEISVFLGRGELDFDPPRRRLVILSRIDPFGFFTDFGGFGLSYGDLDGDGLGDLVVPVETLRGVAVLRGLDGGDFADPEIVPAAGLPYGAAIGDLDGDGMADLATADFTGGSVRGLLNRSR